jgi:DsbC/DsbD-like thiol-disulfide interchange protein
MTTPLSSHATQRRGSRLGSLSGPRFGLGRITRTFIVVTGAGLIGAAMASPHAADAAEQASRLDEDMHSALRLITGVAAADTAVRAGVELHLQAGWHTYWRYPGDAGVPPRFDFSNSENVAAVTVLWPAPKPLPEQGLTAIGYLGDVTWPLSVTPQDPAKPVTLRLNLDYAVCERMCVPAQAKAELALAAGAPAVNPALAAALERVPKKVALGDGSPLAIRAVHREHGTPRDRVVVDVAAAPQTPVALFAEGPAPDWALPVPAAVPGAPAGMQRFVFDLDGAPAGAKYDGAAITLTAVAGEHAIEVITHLD